MTKVSNIIVNFANNIKKWPMSTDTIDTSIRINRLKIVLAEQNRKGKWLAERLGKDGTTISRWSSDTAQPYNTRTTAVFLIKYLNSFGFQVNNDCFLNHSWSFRNALVRSEQRTMQLGKSKSRNYFRRYQVKPLFAL